LPVPAVIRTGVLELLHSVSPTHATTVQINALLGHLFSSSIKSFCRKHNIRLSSVDLVGTDAQTPNRTRRSGSYNADTHPHGWNKLVAAETGITTIFDFRVLERSAFRPHIPPIAFADRILLTHREKFRVCLNIEQLASLTFVPPSFEQNACSVLFRHCGPGNLFIDYAVRYCTSNDASEDRDGSLASVGTVNQELADRICDSHSFEAPPSLSIAAEMFGDHDAQHLINECLALNMCEADIVATITRIVAQNILNQYRKSLKELFTSNQQVDELFICGRGARNSNIIDYLEAKLPQSVITKPLHDIGIPGDANEAICYAHLAFEALLCQTTRRPECLQTDTPNSSSWNNKYVGGKVVGGVGWDDLLARILRFSKGKQLSASTDVRVINTMETVGDGPST
jgi:1,6-anhydro-N-acetylmuramate kinase